MQYYPFDSRNSLYKSVFGALASEENLRLSVLLHRDAKVNKVFLCIRKDSDILCRYEMIPDGNVEDYIVYKKELTFDEGIYWYYFSYESDFGEFYISKSEHSLGIVSKEINVWQLTVYNKDFKTPDWIKGGIIYQIFPDRFYKSEIKKENNYKDRYIESNWNATPKFENDSIGKDYFGGDLKGIEAKLPYLASLSVSAIYLNPIFEAHSNHRYNTADYLKIDSMLGTEDDLISLCNEALKYGISVILDGVFSHTGEDSIYFNKNGRYESVGAYNDKNSPYFDWYTFNSHPNSYKSWWGISSLPETNENSPSFTEFITGENGVIRYWLKRGIKGWRLDVADELPDEFLDNLRRAAKKENPDAFILGEVWEDATNKISHGGRRRFLLGNQLDSVMNYPFYDAIIDFLLGENSRKLIDRVLDITENYPPQCINSLMNHIGTHDTERIITKLSNTEKLSGDRNWQSAQKIADKDLPKAKRFLKLAATLQYTLPGVPSLYYGDEALVEGFGDPFCRKTYPWGKEDTELLDFYINLGRIRKENECFKEGKFIPIYANMGHIAYIREYKENSILIAVNRWCDDAYIDIPDDFKDATVLFGNKPDGNTLRIEKENLCILKRR